MSLVDAGQNVWSIEAMSAEDEITIIRGDEGEFVELPLPGQKGITTRLIRVDEENNQVVMHVRFEPGSYAPRHYHYCRAVAYTISGAWEYDEGKFYPGDVAYEKTGNLHTPFSDEGAEIMLVLSADDKKYLDNYMECGSIIRYTLDTFKFFEGKSQADIDALSVNQLFSKVEFIPAENVRLRDLYNNLMDSMKSREERRAKTAA